MWRQMLFSRRFPQMLPKSQAEILLAVATRPTVAGRSAIPAGTAAIGNAGSTPLMVFCGDASTNATSVRLPGVVKGDESISSQPPRSITCALIIFSSAPDLLKRQVRRGVALFSSSSRAGGVMVWWLIFGARERPFKAPGIAFLLRVARHRLIQMPLLRLYQSLIISDGRFMIHRAVPQLVWRPRLLRFGASAFSPPRGWLAIRAICRSPLSKLDNLMPQ